MIDERDLFERAAERFEPPVDAFERFSERQVRHHRNQRIAAGVVAAAIAAIVAGALTAALRSPQQVHPATPPDLFTGVHGWIAVPLLDGIVAVDPSDPTQRVSLSSDPGDPLEWSSDGTELLVSRRDGLHVLHADGTDVHVTRDDFFGKFGSGGSFSRDGQNVVFGYDGGIWSVSSAGGKPRLLLKSEVLAGPVSSLGRLTYEQGSRLGPYTEIWTMDSSDAGDQRRLVSASTLRDVFGQVPISDVFPLSWSPDGSQLLFAESSQKSGLPLPDGRTIPSGSVFCALMLANADGSGVQTIRRPDVCPWAASWSPDGSRIVVSLQDSRDLITMDRDGSGTSRLVVQGLPPIVQHVAWNPASP